MDTKNVDAHIASPAHIGRLHAGGMLPTIDTYIFSRHALVNSMHLLDAVAEEMGVSVATIPTPSPVRSAEWPITVVSNISERVKTRRQQMGGADVLKCGAKVDTTATLLAQSMDEQDDLDALSSERELSAVF